MCLFFNYKISKNPFKKLDKLYVKKVVYYYLGNDFLNPQQNSDFYFKYW